MPYIGNPQVGFISADTLAVSGTVDGRDVSVDGTKLDTIETSATADQTNAEIRAAVEAASDSNVFTDADHTKLNGIEASADVTDATNVAAAGAAMLSGATFTGVVSATTFEPTSGTSAGDNAAIGYTSDRGLNLTGQGSDSDVTIRNDAASIVCHVPTGTQHLQFLDNRKAVFGSGSDMEIFHDSGNSFIKDNGNGDLVLRTNGANILLQNSNNQNMIRADSTNGEVKLFHGTSSASEKLATTSTGAFVAGKLDVGSVGASGGTAGEIAFGGVGGSIDGFRVRNTEGNYLELSAVSSGNKMVLTNTGNVGIGTASPSSTFRTSIKGDYSSIIGGIEFDSGGGDKFTVGHASATSPSGKINVVGAGNLVFATNNSEVSRFDSSGNFLVGKSVSGSFTQSSVELNNTGYVMCQRDNGAALFLSRGGTTSTGAQIALYNGNAQQGTLGNKVGRMYLGSFDTGLVFEGYFNDCVIPFSPDGQNIRDNYIKLGYASSRFNEIFCTNTNINTSDETEKQDIATLTSAEMTAAKSISALFKTYKWKDAVAAKGDAARIHTGVIAQEVQAAMSAAGLDATKYAFWCSDTWWESEETIKKENGENHTAIVPYQTAEDAPKGATKRTRLGVRYPELLAFIGAATEQRLADIETRLAALES